MFWLFMLLTIGAAALTWLWIQNRQTHLVNVGLLTTLAFLLLAVAQRLQDFGRGFFTALGAVGLVGVVLLLARTPR
jgi:drug/metabolite transporter superfamily protein YnfA